MRLRAVITSRGKSQPHHWLAALLLLLLATLAFSATAGPAKEVMDNKRYRFCHEERYPLYPTERLWCEHAEQGNDDCPALKAACEADVKPEVPADNPFARRRSGDGGGKAKKPKLRKPGDGPDDRKARRKRMKLNLPSGLSGVAQVLLLLLLAVGIALIVRAIIKNSVDGKDDAEPLPDDEAAPAQQATAEAKRIVETDVERLLRLAREAAGRGQYEEAIELAYAASLRRLEGDALIDMHESQTNGDYVRGLRRRHPDLAQALRAVVRDVERVQFGSLTADAALFQTLLGRVMGIVGRVAAVVLFCLSLGASMGCVEETLADEDIPEEVALARGSYSPSGSRAVLGVLREHGHKAAYRGKDLSELDDEIDALVLLPGGEPKDDEGWDALFDWAGEEERRLILAGIAPPSRLMNVHLIESESADAEVFGAGQLSHALGSLSTPIPPKNALDISDGVFTEAILVRDYPASEVYAAKRVFSDGDVMVMADAQLFTNIAMVTGDDAKLMLRLLEGYERVELADPWTGGGSNNPIQAMHNAKLTPLVLQLMILLALFMLWKGRAFGTLRDPVEYKRRSFADHVKALGLQYARARATNHAVGRYSHWAIERLRARVPRGKQRSIDELADMIAARARKDPAAVRAVLQQAQAAGDVAGPPSFRVSSVRGQGVGPTNLTAAPRIEGMTLLRQLSELMAAVTGATTRASERASQRSESDRTQPATRRDDKHS